MEGQERNLTLKEEKGKRQGRTGTLRDTEVSLRLEEKRTSHLRGLQAGRQKARGLSALFFYVHTLKCSSQLSSKIHENNTASITQILTSRNHVARFYKVSLSHECLLTYTKEILLHEVTGVHL